MTNLEKLRKNNKAALLTWLNMVQHLLGCGHQLFGQDLEEILAGMLEGPLIVENHPLGADKPEPVEDMTL